MLSRMKELLNETRKGNIISLAYIVKVLATIGSFLTVFLHWSPTQVNAWAELSKHVEDLLSQLGNLTAMAGALWAALIAVEDSAHKLGLPWFGGPGTTLTASTAPAGGSATTVATTEAAPKSPLAAKPKN